MASREEKIYKQNGVSEKFFEEWLKKFDTDPGVKAKMAQFSAIAKDVFEKHQIPQYVCKLDLQGFNEEEWFKVFGKALAIIRYNIYQVMKETGDPRGSPSVAAEQRRRFDEILASKDAYFGEAFKLHGYDISPLLPNTAQHIMAAYECKFRTASLQPSSPVGFFGNRIAAEESEHNTVSQMIIMQHHLPMLDYNPALTAKNDLLTL